jgi:hypothetical protein
MFSHRYLVHSLLAALVVFAVAPAYVADQPSVAVDGSEFIVTLGDGRKLHSPELVGAVLSVDTSTGPLRVRIDAVERDPDARRGPVWLHSLSTQTADGSWQHLCEAGPDGRRQAFPLAFRPRSPDGAMEPAPEGRFELICTGGALGKCVRFGYPPWVGLAAYNACIRLVRADYCGDGAGTTRNGMRIDLYDDSGIQTADGDPAQDLEAGWTAEGAVCVRHIRVKENTSLDAIANSCPRLRGRLGNNCTEERARELGANLFNRSAP